MILLTHFNGKRIALNVELIEKIEETPDTVITLTNGARYIVHESLDEVIGLCDQARARIIGLAAKAADSGEESRLRLVRGMGDAASGHPEGEGPG